MSNVTSPWTSLEDSPEPTCPRHAFGAPDCGACQLARQHFQHWMLQQRYSTNLRADVDAIAANVEKLEEGSLLVSGTFLVEQDSINTCAEHEHGAALVGIERQQCRSPRAGRDESSEFLHQGLEVTVGEFVFASAVDETCSHCGAPFSKPLGGVNVCRAPHPTQAIPFAKPVSTGGSATRRRSRLAAVVDRIWFALAGRRGRRSA